MGIKSEKTTSQRLNGSPAQIMAENLTLATVIFGSNSAACDFCAKYSELNAGIESLCADSEGFELPVPDGMHARTHAHTI